MARMHRDRLLLRSADDQLDNLHHGRHGRVLHLCKPTKVVVTTGRNYYIRERKPTIKKAIHIGKRSWGWLFHWDSCDEINYPRWCDEDPDWEGQKLPCSIHSVEDIRSYLRTGEWELVDEYGTVYQDWEAEIAELMAWGGGNHDDADYDPRIPAGYRDAEGQIFDRGDGFS